MAGDPALCEKYPDNLVSASVISDNQCLLNCLYAELATHMYCHFLHTFILNAILCLQELWEYALQSRVRVTQCSGFRPYVNFVFEYCNFDFSWLVKKSWDETTWLAGRLPPLFCCHVYYSQVSQALSFVQWDWQVCCMKSFQLVTWSARGQGDVPKQSGADL